MYVIIHQKEYISLDPISPCSPLSSWLPKLWDHGVICRDNTDAQSQNIKVILLPFYPLYAYIY